MTYLAGDLNPLLSTTILIYSDQMRFLRTVTIPAFTSGSCLPGGQLWRGLIFFTTDRPHYYRMPPLSGDNHGWVGFCCANGLCVRSPCHHNSRMRTFDENSCAISIMSPRSLFRPRTQQVWWDHREKSRRASTLWDCRGKSRLPGKVPANGTWCERRVWGIPLSSSVESQKGRY